MTDPAPTPSRRGARTFRAACAVLATVAAAQAAATAWSTRTTAEAARVETVAPPPTVEKIPAPPAPPVLDDQDPYPEMQVPAGDPPPFDPALAALEPQPVMSVPRPRAPAPLDVTISDDEVLENLDAALHLKSEGDMQGALTRLRAALQKLPEHPRLLYHTAQTMDTLGLAQKALPLWKQLHKLGNGAGDYFVLSQERLANGPQIAPEPEEEKEGKFTVKDLSDEKVADATGGERVRVTAVLKKHTEEAVNLEKDMVLATHFFDTVNGRRVARSQVGQPAVECISLPLDWKDGTETFVFEYWQPDMTAEQIVRYGRCKYYGCALEVFFKDKLQDSTATADMLLRYARELPVPAPESESSILDTAPLPGSAEPGLFPPQSMLPPPLKP